MNGLPYYKAYPRDFIEGTIGMTFEEKGAYRLVLDLIYMQDGNLPDDAKYISGLLGCSVRKWNSLRQRLLDLGKIQAVDGVISNFRACKELESTRTLQDKMAENRRRPNKNNELQSQQSHHTDTDIDSVTNVTGGDAADDFAKQVFDRAVVYLGRHGVSDDKARKFVGQLRKAHTDTEIFDAFTAASKAGAVDPMTYIRGVLKPKPKRQWEMTPHEMTEARL